MVKIGDTVLFYYEGADANLLGKVVDVYQGRYDPQTDQTRGLWHVVSPEGYERYLTEEPEPITARYVANGISVWEVDPTGGGRVICACQTPDIAERVCGLLLASTEKKVAA